MNFFLSESVDMGRIVIAMLLVRRLSCSAFNAMLRCYDHLKSLNRDYVYHFSFPWASWMRLFSSSVALRLASIDFASSLFAAPINFICELYLS